MRFHRLVQEARKRREKIQRSPQHGPAAKKGQVDGFDAWRAFSRLRSILDGAPASVTAVFFLAADCMGIAAGGASTDDVMYVGMAGSLREESGQKNFGSPEALRRDRCLWAEWACWGGISEMSMTGSRTPLPVAGFWRRRILALRMNVIQSVLGAAMITPHDDALSRFFFFFKFHSSATGWAGRLCWWLRGLVRTQYRAPWGARNE